ncbi:MAG: hypothetical protein N2690_01135 [Rhodocyclaceae bacterium]|nr:hypothetical protein [Rhodocyclaceae bacterium]
MRETILDMLLDIGFQFSLKDCEKIAAIDKKLFDREKSILEAAERERAKAKRLEDALRGMLEAHLLEDYSNSGHYLDLCGEAWMKARDVIAEECDGVKC